MTAEINKDNGNLEIRTENKLEEYALAGWVQANKNELVNHVIIFRYANK